MQPVQGKQPRLERKDACKLSFSGLSYIANLRGAPKAQQYQLVVETRLRHVFSSTWYGKNLSG
jgi:hypothetical protein